MTDFLTERLAKVVVWIILLLLGLLWAFPVMWCWNYVMPYLFSLPEIGWGRTYCLMLLANATWRNFSFVTLKSKES